MGRLYQRQDAIESEKYAEIRITPLRAVTRAGQGKFSFFTPRTKTTISADPRPPSN